MNMHKKSILISVLVLLSSLLPQVHADSDRDIELPNLPLQLADRLGVDAFAGKLLASMIFMLLFMLPAMFLAGVFGRDPFSFGILTGLGSLGVCVALDWLPIYLFALPVLLIAILYAKKFTGMIG